MEFEHESMNCHRKVREILMEIQRQGEVVAVLRQQRDWLEWYYAHHCLHCGGCDDLEALPPEQDGLCIYCWKTEYERQQQIGVTPSA